MRPRSILVDDETTSTNKPRQLSFDGMASAPLRGSSRQKLNKLLLMTKPPYAVSEKIFHDAERHALGRTTRSAYPAELLHVSLLCIGAFQGRPDGVIARISAALRNFSARAIRITLNTAAHFGNRRSLVLKNTVEVPEMTCLTQTLQRTLRLHNVPHIRQSNFTPHVTVIYGCGE